MSEIDNRERILVAATHLFAHKGYGSTSVREVVEAAGVTKPTLYYYFENKEALFREVISWKMASGERVFSEAIAAGGTAVDVLRRVVTGLVDSARGDLDGLRLVMTCGLPMSDGQPRVDVMERHLRNIAPLAALVEQGQAQGQLRPEVDPTLAVVALLGTVNLQMMALLKGEPFSDDVIDALIDTWLHGVST